MKRTQALTGVVQEGEKRGARLGFPTANIALPEAALSGIYAARVVADGRMHTAAVYADERRKLLEAHLLDFSGNLYGKTVTVELVEKLREDARFENEVALKAAIADDIARVREYFKANP